MSEITQLLDGAFAAASGARRTPLFVQGKVTDNADKQNAGMVKVEFLSWENGKNICEWMPLLRPYAGRDYGAYLVPEVGDLVLVGFLGDDGRRPFVLGVLFPADTQFPKQHFDEKNANRAFRTKGGHEVVFSDEKGKEKCTVTTPGGLSVQLDDEKQTIALSDKNGKNALRMDCKGGQTELCADAKIVLKTGRCTITMDGKGGEVKIESSRITAKASGQVSVSGTQSVQISGGMLTAEGKQTAQFKGGAMAQLSAGMVKIN